MGIDVIIVRADPRAGTIAIPYSEGAAMASAQIDYDSHEKVFQLAAEGREATDIAQDRVGYLVMLTDGNKGESSAVLRRARGN
jgi:hypothetical protein